MKTLIYTAIVILAALTSVVVLAVLSLPDTIHH